MSFHSPDALPISKLNRILRLGVWPWLVLSFVRFIC